MLQLGKTLCLVAFLGDTSQAVYFLDILPSVLPEYNDAL